MRDHPDKPAGGVRSRKLWHKYRQQAEKNDEHFGNSISESGAPIPVIAPKVRIRREHFGAEAYQPLNDQRTKLTLKEFDVLHLCDGTKSAGEICASCTHTEPEFVHSTLDRLTAGHALRWSRHVYPRPPRVENYGDGRIVDRLSSPVNILWEPTLRCNLQCNFCYNESGPLGDVGEDRKLVARQIVDAGTFQVSIVGGEPTVLPDFYNLIEYFEQNGVGVDFVTNGWFIDELAVEKLCESEICQLMVSLDGLEDTHDRLRGRKGSFKRALRAITLLSEAGFEVTVAPCLQRENVAELENLIDAIVSAGAYRIKIRPMIAEGRARSMFIENGLTLGEIERYQPLIKKKAEEYRNIVSIVHRMPANQLGVCACDYNPSCPGIIEKYKGTCGIGRTMCYIRVDGCVSPNSNLRETIIGNCLTEPLLSIWQDDRRWNHARPPNRAGFGNIRS